MNPGFELKEKVATLQDALLNAHPTMPVLLRTIHKQLREDPELVTTLTEEEIGIIVSGLSKQTNTEIATTVTKAPSATKKLKDALKGKGSAEDLF